jgi:Trk K+ transport system NAD-binding subunit
LKLAGGEQMFMGKIQPGSPMAGRSIEEMCGEFRGKVLKVLAIFRGEEVLVPHGSSRLKEEDRLLVVCDPEMKELLERGLVFEA